MTTDLRLMQRQPVWRRVARRLARQVISWHFRRFNPSTHGGHEVKVAGVQLTVARGVFDPSLHFTSGFLANYIKMSRVLAEDAAVLDVGTGTGILAIAAAMSGSKSVVGVDLNPSAVECARLNVRKHGLDAWVDVRQGKFAPVQTGTTYDHVICNPPYFRGTASNSSQQAYLAGPDLEWFDSFIRHIEPCLAPHGKVLLVLSDSADLASILARFTAASWAYKVVARRDILIEVMYVIELTPKTQG